MCDPLYEDRVQRSSGVHGDVLRCEQTSIRVDVVGGRKRPDAGMNPRVLAGLIVGVLVLAGLGIGGGMYLKKKQQRKRDLATLADPAEAVDSNAIGANGTLGSGGLGAPWSSHGLWPSTKES
jgi:hypothetical protein